MPKCELKPWRIDEPQVVFVRKDGSARLKVAFVKVKDIEGKEFQARIIVEDLCVNGEWKENWNYHGEGPYPFENEWAQEFVSLLGIPISIEEEKK